MRMCWTSLSELSKDLEINDSNLLDGDEPSATDEALEALQYDLLNEKDARREERFIWFVVVVVLFDAMVFQSMTNFMAPLVIGVIELLLLIALGRKWGMDSIWTLTEMIVNRWDGRVGK